MRAETRCLVIFPRIVAKNRAVATYRRFSRVKRFSKIFATATGPTPPGTGVNTHALSAHAGSASPRIFPAISEVPASTRAMPSLIMSGLIKPGLPAPRTPISASFNSYRDPCSRVTIETVAPSRRRRCAEGAPTSRPPPTTTAFFPSGTTPPRFRSSTTARATGANTGLSSSDIVGFNASTS
jgi:hypothetical protein